MQPRAKGSNSVQVMTFRVISLNRKSTKTTKNKGKTAIIAIKYYAPDRTMLFSFYNHPQLLWVWADGTSINPKKMNLHVDVHGRGKSQYKRRGRTIETQRKKGIRRTLSSSDEVQGPEPTRPCRGASLLGYTQFTSMRTS